MMERDPDLSLGGFSLWLTGQPYPDAEEPYGQDLWDFQTAIETPCSTVRTAGVLSAASLSGFSRDLNAIHETLGGEAVLEADGGGATLILTLAMRSRGHVETVLDLRLGYGDDERHRFVWDLDQTFLEPFARQVRALSSAYPSPFPARILERDRVSEPQKSGLTSRILDAIFGKRPDPN
jgi:hypothetical protein